MIDENAERHDPGTHSPPRGGEFRLGRARARLGIAISGAVRFLGTVRPYRRPSSRSAKTMGGGRRPKRFAGSLGIDAEELLCEASEWTTHVIDRGEDKNARLYWFRMEGTAVSKGRKVAILGEESWRAKFLMSLLFRPMNIITFRIILFVLL